jgi:hypothetical protein
MEVTLSMIEGNMDIQGKDFLSIHKLKLLPCIMFSVAVISWKRYLQSSKYWMTAGNVLPVKL